MLYDELQQADPTFAATLDPSKSQRLIRSLEVFYGTGKPLSYFHQYHLPAPFSFFVVVLVRPRSELYERIEARVDEMLDAGLLDEVQGLLDAGYASDLNPLRTIGYQEPIAYFQGKTSREEMIRLLKRNSRRYAKRQLTWFRRYPDYHWFDLSQSPDLKISSATILSQLNSSA